MTPTKIQMVPSRGADRERLFDQILVVVCAIALVFVTGLLVTDFSFFRPTVSGSSETVARIGETMNSVRRRSAGLPVWNKAQPGEAVMDRDQVFTDADSATVLEFVDGSEVELGENTLVTVEKQREKATFNVLRGALAAKAGDGSVEIEIQVGKTKTVVQSKDTEINVKKSAAGETSIAVVGGRATIATGGKTVELGPDQVSSFSKEGALTGIRKIPFRLSTPADDEVIYFGSHSGGKVAFDWQPVAGVKTYKFQLARDRNFARIVEARPVGGTRLALAAPEGAYFWRVGGVVAGSGEEYSLERSVRLIEDRAPKLYKPTDDGTLTYQEMLEADRKPGSDESATADFHWERQKGDPRYTFQLASDAGFQRVLREEREIEEPRLTVGSLGEGAYFWRVRAVAEARPRSPWSETRSFRVARVRLPAPPSPLGPGEEVLLTTAQPVVEFSWDRQDAVHTYLLEISRDKRFEEVVTRTRVRGTVLRWEPVATGEFYWRVRAIDHYGRETLFNERREIEIEVAPPEGLLPEEARTFTLVEQKTPIEFRWRKAPLAERYALQIARDERFRDLVLDQETDEPVGSWNDLQVGKYHWRILTFVKGREKAITGPAKRFEIIDVPLPAPPVLQPRFEIDVEAKFEKPSGGSRFGWLRWIQNALAETKKKNTKSRRRSPRAGSARKAKKTPAREARKTARATRAPSARETDSDRLIRWEGTGPGNRYLLEVARDDSFESILFSRETATPQLEWGEGRPGKYFMRVATIDRYGRRGPFSNTSTLIIRPYPPELLQPKGPVRIVKKGKKVPFRWKPIENAVRYTLEVSDKADFSKLTFSESTWSPAMEVELTKSGDYVWRVKAVGPDDIETRFSAPARLALDYSPPDPSPPDGVESSLAVAPSPRYVRYRFEVAKNATFDPLWAEDESESNRFNLSLAPGTYYWRAAGVDGNGRTGKWTAPRKLVIASPKLARGPDSVGSSMPSSSVVHREPGKPRLLVLRIGYGPVLNDYAQASSDPAATFQGFAPVAYGGSLEFWFNRWIGIHGGFSQQQRQIFSGGEVGLDQEPIEVIRRNLRVGAVSAFRLFSNLPLVTTLRLSYQYKNLVSFRTRTSTSLQLLASDLHLVQGGLGFELPLSRSLLAAAELRYAHPFAVNNIRLTGSTNLGAELSLRYQLHRMFSLEAGYALELSQFSYTDGGDPLTGSVVSGTIKDHTQSLFVGLISKFDI